MDRIARVSILPQTWDHSERPLLRSLFFELEVATISLPEKQCRSANPRVPVHEE